MANGVHSFERRGTVLVTVLFLIVAVSALVLACQLQARYRLTLTANLDTRLRTEWVAEGCAASIQWSLQRALADSSNGSTGGGAVWRRLDEVLKSRPLAGAAHCRWNLSPAGLRLSINDAEETDIAEVLTVLGWGATEARNTAASLADWIDADDIERPGGAEASWYRSRRRLPPGNRPLQSIGELRTVRGMERAANAAMLLGVDVEPVNALHASPEVLRLLPGASDELVARILDVRERKGSLPELEELAQGLSFGARQVLDAKFTSLKARYAREPYAWALEVSVADESGSGVRLRQRFTRSGRRLAVQQEWREWL